MKDHISNSLLRECILSKNLSRLTVVTGKGGVGKTSVALAITKSLQSQGFKAIYNNFDQYLNQNLIDELEIQYLHLTQNESAQKYIAQKLGSETIAKWIMLTPFFKSLLNMLPGLSHMILLGHIINMLEEDPDLYIVMDSPSSGHALTMFESSQNFKEIFRSGLLVQDIDRLQNFIFNNNNLKTIIVTLPTLMSFQESSELKESLNQRNIENVKIVLNDFFPHNELVIKEKNHLPDFLKTKYQLENEVLKEHEKEISGIIPHYNSISPREVVWSMTHLLGGA